MRICRKFTKYETCVRCTLAGNSQNVKRMQDAHRQEMHIIYNLCKMHNRRKFTKYKKKVSKAAKIRNRYNQVPHPTQDTNGKVTNTQQTPQTRAKRPAPPPRPSRRPQSTHKQTHTKTQQTQDRTKTQRSTKEAPPRNGQQNIPLEGPNQPHGANLTLDSDVDQNIFGKVTKQHKKQPRGQPFPNR